MGNKTAHIKLNTKKKENACKKRIMWCKLWEGGGKGCECIGVHGFCYSNLMVPLCLAKVLVVLNIWARLKLLLCPKIRGQVCVCTHNSLECSLSKVTQSSGLTGGRCVAVLNTSHVQKLLGGWCSNDTSTTWGWDEAHKGTTATTSGLHWHGMGLTKLVTPVSTTHGLDGKLGVDDGTTNGSGNFLGALDAKTKVPVVVTSSNKGFEAGALTSSCLLLNGHDLEHLVMESLLGEENVNDFRLLNGKAVEVHFLDACDLAVLHEATKLCDGLPFGLLATIATTTAATATTATTTTATTTTPALAGTSIFTGRLIRHWCLLDCVL